MIYNLVLNSNNYVSGTNTSNFSYYFDWSNIEEGSYELTFNFNASATTVDKVLAVVCPDLGVASNVFTTTSNTASRFNNVLGVLYPTIVSGDNDYITSASHNPPVYLKTRPHSNNFTIYLYNTDGALTDIAVDYILILSLRKL